MSRFVVLVTFALALSGVAQQAPRAERVLFIGNSLTSFNNLPDLVARLARADGHPMTCEMVAMPDFSLEDHWAQGEAKRRIDAGGWTTVVLQQGPSALPESRVLLIDYTKRFDAEIRKHGARTALYMVWPSASRRFDFPGVSESYRAAAKSVGGLILPVGDAWQAVWTRDAAFALYGPDAFHPSPAASALAALVIYQGIADRVLKDERVLAAMRPWADLTAIQRGLLVAAANDVRAPR